MPKEKQSQEWSAEQIFTFVLESAMLSEHALAAYCKERGLYVEQVKQWKKSCITANLPDSVKRTQMGKENRVERKRIKQLEKEIPFYAERHRVKPGLTGWAQLCYPYGSDVEDARNKLEFDLYYVKNASVFLDLIILLETVEVVVWGKGAH